MAHGWVNYDNANDARKQLLNVWQKLSKVIMICLPRKKREAYLAYKQGCNAFFMQLVGQLCFEGNQPPQPAVIKRLLDLIIFSPKVTTATVTIELKPLAILSP